MSKPPLSLASHFLSFITTEIGRKLKGYGFGLYKSLLSTDYLLFSIRKGITSFIMDASTYRTAICAVNIFSIRASSSAGLVIAPNGSYSISNKRRGRRVHPYFPPTDLQASYCDLGGAFTLISRRWERKKTNVDTFCLGRGPVVIDNRAS